MTLSENRDWAGPNMNSVVQLQEWYPKMTKKKIISVIWEGSQLSWYINIDNENNWSQFWQPMDAEQNKDTNMGKNAGKRSLLGYADSKDMLLMTLGCLGCIADGATMPLIMLALSRITGNLAAHHSSLSLHKIKEVTFFPLLMHICISTFSRGTPFIFPVQISQNALDELVHQFKVKENKILPEIWHRWIDDFKMDTTVFGTYILVLRRLYQAYAIQALRWWENIQISQSLFLWN